MVAILFAEPEARRFADAVQQHLPALISADLFIYRAGIEIVPVDAERAELGRAAWRRYGKGRRPAGPNYGDCFAYALAKISDAPLLFKGDDFVRTDIRLT